MASRRSSLVKEKFILHCFTLPPRKTKLVKKTLGWIEFLKGLGEGVWKVWSSWEVQGCPGRQIWPGEKLLFPFFFWPMSYSVARLCLFDLWNCWWCDGCKELADWHRCILFVRIFPMYLKVPEITFIKDLNWGSSPQEDQTAVIVSFSPHFTPKDSF